MFHEKELNNTAGVKRYFIAFKGKVDKPDIKKLVNVLSGLNDSKIKVDDLGVDKLKSFPIDL